ncbi:hypothetical protein BH09PSE1_BH09PSE1_08790 [soil metagenome]
MRTPRECLAKAIEMDGLADRDEQPRLRDAWRAMAEDWRKLACRAGQQDDPFLSPGPPMIARG